MDRFHAVRLPPDCARPDSPSAAFEVCRAIRTEVFVEGQAIALEEEFDGLDQRAEHFLVSDAPHRPGSTPPEPRHEGIVDRGLGTARTRIVGNAIRVERMAVRERARRRGVGRALLDAIEAAAREAGYRTLWLHAQVQAIPFYEKLGYRADGPVFVEAGIDHRRMEKRLTRPRRGPTAEGA